MEDTYIIKYTTYKIEDYHKQSRVGIDLNKDEIIITLQNDENLMSSQEFKEWLLFYIYRFQYENPLKIKLYNPRISQWFPKTIITISGGYSELLMGEITTNYNIDINGIGQNFIYNYDMKFIDNVADKELKDGRMTGFIISELEKYSRADLNKILVKTKRWGIVSTIINIILIIIAIGFSILFTIAESKK